MMQRWEAQFRQLHEQLQEESEERRKCVVQYLQATRYLTECDYDREAVQDAMRRMILLLITLGQVYELKTNLQEMVQWVKRWRLEDDQAFGAVDRVRNESREKLSGLTDEGSGMSILIERCYNLEEEKKVGTYSYRHDSDFSDCQVVYATTWDGEPVRMFLDVLNDRMDDDDEIRFLGKDVRQQLKEVFMRRSDGQPSSAGIRRWATMRTELRWLRLERGDQLREEGGDERGKDNYRLKSLRWDNGCIQEIADAKGKEFTKVHKAESLMVYLQKSGHRAQAKADELWWQKYHNGDIEDNAPTTKKLNYDRQEYEGDPQMLKIVLWERRLFRLWLEVKKLKDFYGDAGEAVDLAREQARCAVAWRSYRVGLDQVRDMLEIGEDGNRGAGREGAGLGEGDADGRTGSRSQGGVSKNELCDAELCSVWEEQ